MSDDGKKSRGPVSIGVLGTTDGDVVLRVEVKMSAYDAVQLGKVLVKAAQVQIRKKPIIVPGGQS